MTRVRSAVRAWRHRRSGLALPMVCVLLVCAGRNHAEDVRTDLYGDPLPPGAVARLGTIRLRHTDADVVFSKDGKQLISCGCDAEVRTWDAATGKLLRCQRLSWKPREGERLLRVALSPDGATAAVWDQKVVQVYDTTTGKERGRISARCWAPPLLTFSSDGKVLVVQHLTERGEWLTRLWNIAGGQKRPLAALDAQLTQVVFTADGKRLAGIVYGLSSLHLWDATTGAEIGKREGVDVGPDRTSLAFSPDGRTLAVGLRSSGQVRLLDSVTGEEKATRKAPAHVKAHSITWLAFSPDGRQLAGTCSQDASNEPSEVGVIIWDVAGAKPTRCLPERSYTRLAFAPDGRTLLCHNVSSGEFRLWDVSLGRQRQHRAGHDCPVQALAVSPNGQVIASGAADGMLRLWGPATARPLGELKVHRKIASCLFSPDGKRVISTGQTGMFDEICTFQTWDVARGEELRRIDLGPQDRFIYAVRTSADGKRLTAAVGPDSPRLFVWDLASGERLRQRPYQTKVDVHVLFDGRSSTFSEAHAAFAPDGERMTEWLGDRVGIKDIATARLLVTLPQGLGRPMVFSPDGRLLAATILSRTPELDDRVDRKGLSLIEAASGEEVHRLEVRGFDSLAFTPDGRGVVVADKNALRVWDTTTGELLHRRTWPQSVVDRNGEPKVCSLVALPRGRVATGMTEGDILVWDLAASTWPVGKPAGDLGRKELDALWCDLAADARKAHRAVSRLAAAPAQTVPLLRARLRPAAELNAKDIDKLLADLDGDAFAVRESASRELAGLCDRIEPMLRRALRDRPSLEKRCRIQQILSEPRRPSAERLRALRAIAVLERIGTAEACGILKELRGGAAAPETHAAQAALQRLKRR